MTDFTNEELGAIKELARHEMVLADFLPKIVSNLNVTRTVATASTLSIKCDAIIEERNETAKKAQQEAKKEA